MPYYGPNPDENPTQAMRKIFNDLIAQLSTERRSARTGWRFVKLMVLINVLTWVAIISYFIVT